MDVVNGYLARKRKGAEATPSIALAGGWMAAADMSGGTAADPQTAPDETARPEEKFGVYKDALFDFRDYGLD